MSIIPLLGYGMDGKNVQMAYCHYCWRLWKEASGKNDYMAWANSHEERPCVMVDGQWMCVDHVEVLAEEMRRMDNVVE